MLVWVICWGKCRGSLFTRFVCLFNPFFLYVLPSTFFPSSSSTASSSTYAPGGNGGSSGSLSNPSLSTFTFLTLPLSFLGGAGNPISSASISRIASSSSSCSCSSNSRSSLIILLNPLVGRGGGRNIGLSPALSSGARRFKPDGVSNRLSGLAVSASFRFVGVAKAGLADTRWTFWREGVEVVSSKGVFGFVAEEGEGGVVAVASWSKIPRTSPAFWGVGPTASRVVRLPKRRWRRTETGDS